MIEKLKNRFRTSLSARLSYLTVLFAMAIFLAALGFMFRQSRAAVRQEAISHANQVLENTSQRVEAILSMVERAAINTEWQILRHVDSPDSMFVFSRSILEQNPDLNGCSIAFEPYTFPEYGRYFSAFSYNDGKTIETAQEGNELYQYFYMDWYAQAKLLDKPTWTEPFYDYNPNAIYSKEMITSYCRPLRKANGDFIGILSTDLSLKWLSETVSETKPYPNSYSIMIGRGGTYLVHPDSERLLLETIFTPTMVDPDPDLTALGRAMVAGETGMRQLKVDGHDSYVFFRPLGTTGWSMAIVCPEKDIFGGYQRLILAVLIIVVIGLLLMLFVFRKFIADSLKPLGTLAKQTESIASGKFDEELPDTGRLDEVGRLSNAFSNMQHSLVNYIDELTKTTANKERIEGELRIAREIQMSMVPRIFPAFPERDDIDLFAWMTPAKEVGGDLYDFFIQGDNLFFCIGDVSGKGVPASLFMAVTRNLFRVEAQMELPPAEIADKLNVNLSRDNEQNMFVTMFIGQLNLVTGKLDFCNCGHNPPILDGEFMEVEPNAPLGIWETEEFVGESIPDIRGKKLLLYTDGLNEAEDTEMDQYGDDRLLQEAKDDAQLTSRETIEKIIEVVTAFRKGAEPNDDLTMVCLKLK